MWWSLGECDRSAKGGAVQYLDVVSNNASFTDALSNIEPHQHLCGHKSIS